MHSSAFIIKTGWISTFEDWRDPKGKLANVPGRLVHSFIATSGGKNNNYSISYM